MDSFSGPVRECSTLVDLLHRKALSQPERRLYTFLADGEAEEVHLTYGELDRQARAIGATLQDLGASGGRALLLYPPGLEYVAGFFGCMYAGVVAVPAYPPDPARLERTLPRLLAMVADAETTVALTTTPILSMANPLLESIPDLGALRWVATDAALGGLEGGWQEPAVTRDTLAFIQYTSGSTRAPRGVMLTHGNLLHNSALIAGAFEVAPLDVGVLWLPPYHDMGLIGGILQPLYVGLPCILMSPVDFLRRPLRWLQAISRYRGTISGGPNFAYDLCTRKITLEQRAGLDLSSWSLAFNGAEPVRALTLEQFAATFGPCGFRREAFYPCYGLAEGTLIVSGGQRAAPPVMYTVQKAALAQNRVAKAPAGGEDSQAVVGCGHSLGGQKVVIVHPGSRTQSASDEVGEIWVSGPSVAQGYWNCPQETQETFEAYLADTGEGPFLRTGDLGFMKEGELFITGRSKDLIIIRGRNHYPQDIEWTVEQSHPALRPGCGAAFSVTVDDEERLVVVQEVALTPGPSPQAGRGEGATQATSWPDTGEVVRAIRQAVAEAHDVQVYAVVLIEPKTMFKTSSGKVQRHACRGAFLAGTLNVVTASTLESTEDAPAGMGPVGEKEPEVPAVRESLLVKALLALAPAERQALLESHIQEQVARVLRLTPSQLDPQQPLSTLGLDSVTTVDLAVELESSLGVRLSLESLIKEVTISHIASQALRELTATASRSPATPPLSQRAVAREAAVQDAVAQGVVAQEVAAQCPLSHGQRALWFLQQLSPASGAYNLVQAVRIGAGLDVAALRRAFQRLVDRHPALRTTFAAPHGEPVQRVHEHGRLDFEVEDASDWSAEHLDGRLAEEVYRPFDLEHGPLLRLRLFTLRAGEHAPEHILVMAMHHTVTDLWSMAVLLAELGVLYPAERAGVPASLRPPRAQYADYVRQQAEMLAGPEGERLWSYWQQQLAGEIPVLNLPTDRPRPEVQTYRGSSQAFRIDAALTRQLQSLSQAHGVPLHTTLLAAFQVLLHRYTGQDDILVGSPKAGRSPQMARVMGYLVNPVVLRANLAGDPTFAALLEQVGSTVQGAFEHDAYPFPLLVERLQPVRDVSRSPLAQVMFAWQKTTRMVSNQPLAPFALGQAGGTIEVGGLVLEPVELKERAVPFDLSLWLAESDGELTALVEYNTDLFEAATITRLAGHWQTLLEGIAADAKRRISKLPLLTDAERHQVLVEWNDTATGEPEADCIHQAFEAQVERTPDVVAITCGEKDLTYRELNGQANQLAHYLRRLGVGPETVVGLRLERSLEAVVGLLGILKAGGAYLPLDPGYPQEQLAFMLEDTGAPVLVTESRLLERLALHSLQADPGPGRRVVCLDADRERIAQESDENPQDLVAADNVAYIIYTSGSTGQPKGVLVSHRAIADHCRDMQRFYELGPGDRVLQFASFNFDASLEQIVCALTAGARLVVRGTEVWTPVEFQQVILETGLTVINVPPAYWHQVAQAWASTPAGVSVGALRLAIIGGDVMQPETLRLWQQTPMKGVRLLNAYGPTETTITATTFEVPAPGDEQALQWHIPIGRPLPDRKAYVLDGYGNPVPVGVPGELYLGGRGLARGYLNRPELTAERFVPDPHPGSLPGREREERGERLYRTGDVVRYRPDGRIEFLGRSDNQVKVRGFRIELGEMETVLRQHPALREVAVVAREDTAGDKRLVAYAVLDGAAVVADGQPAPTGHELRLFAQARLPAHMVPSAFVILEALPLTPLGKIDRRALPAPDEAHPEAEGAYVAPRTPVEEELARLWSQVLGIERVGVYDNFFELGGHSLLATQLIARVRETFLVELPLRNLFDTPMVAGLATTIAQSLAEQEEGDDLAQLLAELKALPEEEVQRMLAVESPKAPHAGGSLIAVGSSPEVGSPMTTDPRIEESLS